MVFPVDVLCISNSGVLVADTRECELFGWDAKVVIAAGAGLDHRSAPTKGSKIENMPTGSTTC